MPRSKSTRSTGSRATAGDQFEYTVIFERDLDEGGWVATAPVLAIATQGESLPEARRMIREAITGYLQGLRGEGLRIPTESRQPTRRIRAERIAVTA
jgi:predicted RNase H-like HicB family nuclease